MHFHCLIWLLHNYSPKELQEKLMEEKFRNDLIRYLDDIIKQDLEDYTSDSNTYDLETTLKENNLTISDAIKIENEKLPINVIKSIYNGAPQSKTDGNHNIT